jgi:alpha-galactosidase
LKKGLLSLNVSETGQLTIKNKQGMLFSAALLPLNWGFALPFPYNKLQSIPQSHKIVQTNLEKAEDRIVFTKTCPDFQVSQTIEVASDICKIKTSLTLLRGKPPRNLNLIALSPETLQDSKLLVSGGTMGEIAIKAASELTEGDLSKALLAIQKEEGAELLTSKVASAYPLVLGFFAGTFQGMVSLPHELTENPQQIGEIQIRLGTSAQTLLEEFAKKTAVEVFPPPRGWNSWDYYHSSISHDKIMENVEVLAADPVAASTVQFVILDMGWEIRHGEWDADSNFPHGMEKMAQDIKAKGFEPGIWLAPIIIDPECNAFQDNYDFVGKNSYGFPDRTYECCGLFGYILDVTRPEGEAYLRDLFRSFAQMGYRYFKLDFLRYLMYVDHFHDLTLTNVEVMQKALRIIREGAGEDAYILGCNLPFEIGPGYCDACRVSKDVAVFWDALKKNARSICATYFFNQNWWTNDPDFLVVRGKDTFAGEQPIYRTWWFPREDEFAQHAETFRRRHDREATISYSEAKTYASLVLVLGGAVVLGDPFGYLNSQGKDLLYKVLQAELAPGRPLNLFEEGLAKVWHQPLKAGMRVALFNWEDEPQAIRLDYNALNLHPGQQAVDFWTGEKVQLPEDSVFLLKPRSALVLEFDKP